MTMVTHHELAGGRRLSIDWERIHKPSGVAPSVDVGKRRRQLFDAGWSPITHERSNSRRWLDAVDALV